MEYPGRRPPCVTVYNPLIHVTCTDQLCPGGTALLSMLLCEFLRGLRSIDTSLPILHKRTNGTNGQTPCASGSDFFICAKCTALLLSLRVLLGQRHGQHFSVLHSAQKLLPSSSSRNPSKVLYVGRLHVHFTDTAVIRAPATGPCWVCLLGISNPS